MHLELGTSRHVCVKKREQKADVEVHQIALREPSNLDLEVDVSNRCAAFPEDLLIEHPGPIRELTGN